MTRRRVIKIGGSCLSQADLPQKLNAFLAEFAGSQNLIIVGGGLCIDAMRDLDSRFPLDQIRMHWRCVELLRTSFEILGELLPNLTKVATVDDFQKLLKQPIVAGCYLVAVDLFYNAQTSTSSELPVGWATTTDSIAAYLAKITDADELILVKSCDVHSTDFDQLAKQGVVDDAFPQAAPDDVMIRLLTLPCGN